MTERDEMAVLADELARDAATYAAGTPTRKLLHKAADALRSAARTDAGNDAWLREQATALWAKLCTDCVHSRTEKCDCLDDILAAFSEIAALPAPGGITPVPQLEPWRDELSEIIGHLGAAITQSVANDDQIIMDHVKSAHEIAKIVRRKA